MKKFKEVETTRRDYHKDPTLNSIHRSSLLVPELPDSEVEISFLNHFLLKRNYSKVACKITAIDTNGNKIESKLFTIDKPIVYTIKLSGMTDQKVSNYIIEFFAAENLFIPFPAVMINHRGKNFINQVHAFNRILNDVFEDDAINKNQVKEASIDMIINEKTDTFFLFTAGPLPCKEPIQIEILTDNSSYLKKLDLDIPRFGLKNVSLKKSFDKIPFGSTGIIKIAQPKQFLFYGRMLAGQTQNDGSFSANHSYYDSSTMYEYWDDNRPSSRFYPFFKELSNKVRMYPILSPSELDIFINLYDNDGELISENNVGTLSSPSNRFIGIDVNSIINKNSIQFSKVSTFAVITKVTTGKMPTRIGHQLIYGAGGLDSSIAVSLLNSNVFIPKSKGSFKWGQTIIGGDYDSVVGIVADPTENREIDYHDLSVKFYNKNGLITERNWQIKNKTSLKFQISKELSEIDKSNEPDYVWCTVEGKTPGVHFFSLAYNKISKHSSADHGF